MWVYQCLDILSTVVEMACLYIISGILLKESRFHTSLCKYISPIIMFMVTWILTWFSGLGAFKMPIIFIVAFTVLQVSYKESIYQTVIAIEIWFICCIFLVEAFVYPVSKFIFNNMLLVVIDGQNILRWEVYVIAIATVVLYSGFVQKVGGVSLLKKRITDVFFITKDFVNGARPPFCFTGAGENTISFKSFCNFIH